MAKGIVWREVDHGWKAIKERMEELAKEPPYAKIGLIGDNANQSHEGGMTNAELGIIHEFGAPAAKIPARPWISASFDKNRQKYQTEIAEGLGKVMEGKLSAERLLGLVGAQAASDVKSYVTQGTPIPPPNKPATIAAKGSDRPLVDSGRMVGAVTWAVVKGGE